MNYDNERIVAVETVIKACRLCQTIREKYLPHEVHEKQDQSPVTVADLSAQAVISFDLSRVFPKDPIAAEESLAGVENGLKEKIVSHVKKFSQDIKAHEVFSAIERCIYRGGPRGRFWVLDPVDGTKGFIRGENYAIALALIEEGDVVLSVLGCPNLPIDLKKPDRQKGSIFLGTKGYGSVMRSLDETGERRLKVADVVDPAQALFCESYEPAHSSHSHAARIAEVLGIKNPPLRIDSQSKYGIVARGDATIYLRLPSKAGYEEKIWDHAAGWLIIKDAGGDVTDIHGQPLDFSQGRTLSKNCGVVATNGNLHAQVLSAIKKSIRKTLKETVTLGHEE